jgi:hypothetical protein
MCGLNELTAILSLIAIVPSVLAAALAGLLEWRWPKASLTRRIRDTTDRALTLLIWLFLGGAAGLAITQAARLIWFSAGC